MITSGSRYIGGGKLYFKSSVSGSTEVEIGEVQEATFTIGVSTKEAFSKDEVMKTLLEKVVTEITATVKFTTQVRDAKNMALALLGTATTESFASGSLLPDGTTATATTLIPVINAGTTPVISGQLKFIGDAKGAKKPILLIYNAVITPSSDIGYIVEDFSTLSFEGAVTKTASGYAKEYTMTVA